MTAPWNRWTASMARFEGLIKQVWGRADDGAQDQLLILPRRKLTAVNEPHVRSARDNARDLFSDLNALISIRRSRRNIRSLGCISEKVKPRRDRQNSRRSGRSSNSIRRSIDDSFVPDRMGRPRSKTPLLATHPRSNGQKVPILVRPHPTGRGVTDRLWPSSRPCARELGHHGEGGGPFPHRRST